MRLSPMQSSSREGRAPRGRAIGHALAIVLLLASCAEAEPIGSGPPRPDAGTDAAEDGGGGTGGTTDSSTGGSPPTGGTGGGPACAPPSASPCDTAPQCGCEAGLACNVVDETGATACAEPGTASPFRACAAATDCQIGYGCVSGLCKPYCETIGECGAGKCIQVQTSAGADVPGFKVCTAGCSLVSPAAVCGAQAGCYPDEGAPTYTDCASAGTGTGVGACTDSGAAAPTACAPGFGCVEGSPGSWDCRKWCRIGFVTDCPGAGVCAGFPPGKQLFVEGLEHGVCPP